jgi:hypothetical protein
MHPDGSRPTVIDVLTEDHREVAERAAPTRPHPAAPDRPPPPNKLLAPGAAVVDRVRAVFTGRGKG